MAGRDTTLKKMKKRFPIKSRGYTEIRRKSLKSLEIFFLDIRYNRSYNHI